MTLPQAVPRQYLQRIIDGFEDRIRRLERKVVTATGGGARCTVSDNPPTTPTPVEGDLWYESDTGFLYVYLGSPYDVWVQT